MPPGSLEQVVFRMDVLDSLSRQGIPVINPPAAIEAAVDKYRALSRLQESGLQVPRTFVCQTLDEAMEAFDELGEDVVIKPIFGGEGRGISRLADRDLAMHAFKLLLQLKAVVYLQQFIPHHGYDIRVLVIGDQLLAIRRCSENDWRTNIGRGGRAEPVSSLDPALAELARRAVASVGALVAGVDILPGRDGTYYLLEVNGVPGWKALAHSLDVDVASLMLDLLAGQVAAASWS
jgi:ribosomal protein S6--L-glutamate ligase